jgi:hypothetical protein
MSDNGQLPDSELAPIAGGRLRKDAAAAWNAMNAEARKRGVPLSPTGSASSYRTLAQQQALYALYQSGRGNLAAVPGTSNHGWGLAVDLATPAMRKLLDEIGAKYGWSKEWSDAQTEWWHIKWREGVWQGPDPGAYGRQAKIPEPPEGTVALVAVVKQNGAIEVFVQKQDGSIWHTWQKTANGEWWGKDANHNAKWQSLGKPGA